MQGNATRACMLVARIATLGIVFSATPAAASPTEEALLAKLLDPDFYHYPHRREALADGLAVAETMLAATDGYNEASTVGQLLAGKPSIALRALAAGGGRAGEIARIMLSEAEMGYFGDPKRPLHAALPASADQTTEIALSPGQTQRLIMGTPGTGKVVVGATCAVELREMPLSDSGQFDAEQPFRPATSAHAEHLAEHKLDRSLMHFGVATGPDCGKTPAKLLLAWLPAAPPARANREGQYQIRSSGRHSVPAGPDGTPLSLKLSGDGYYSATVAAEDGELAIAGASESWVPLRRGVEQSARLFADRQGTAEVTVRALSVTRVTLGEEIHINPNPSAQTEIIEVLVPVDADGYLRLTTFDSNDSDPMLGALAADKPEFLLVDDDGAEDGVNARLSIVVQPGQVHRFALRDIHGALDTRLRVELVDAESAAAEH